MKRKYDEKFDQIKVVSEQVAIMSVNETSIVPY